MSTEPCLPTGFAPLQRFVAFWGAATMAERDNRRLASTPEQRQDFYDAAGKLAPAALDMLGNKAPCDLTAGERSLLNLMLSLIHVTLAVELQGHEEHVHAIGARMMPITKGHADPVC